MKGDSSCRTSTLIVPGFCGDWFGNNHISIQSSSEPWLFAVGPIFYYTSNQKSPSASGRHREDTQGASTEPSHTCFCMGLHLLGPFTMARAVNEAPRSSPNSDAALRGFGVEPRAPSATGLLTMQPRGHDHGPSDPLFGATRCASVHWPRRPAQRPAETEPSRSQTRGARGGETMIDERRGVGVGKEDVGDV